MTLRTPRRRKPRTRLRYRSIRQFFRRASGTTSQNEFKINSSIAVNVTNLKRKIDGLEQQLDQVSKHCRDIVCYDSCVPEPVDKLIESDLKNETFEQLSKEYTINRVKNNSFRVQQACHNSMKQKDMHKPDNQIMSSSFDEYVMRRNNKKNKPPKMHEITNLQSKTRSVYNCVAAHSTSSFRSLSNVRILDPDAECAIHNRDKQQLKKVLTGEYIPRQKDKKFKETVKKNTGDHGKVYCDDKLYKNRKPKRFSEDLDTDYISSIIRKQYKPIKLFGAKDSDGSQFTAPVCRDQEFPVQENIQEGSELCSCFYGEVGHKRLKPKRQEFGMKSVCDTRLYSPQKFRQRNRRINVDAYSNSDVYDLVPVKERSSPKTRKKFIEDNIIPYDYCKEVPPSPKSMRPRLNLKAQHYAHVDDNVAVSKRQLRRHSPVKQKQSQDRTQYVENESRESEKWHPVKNQDDINNLQYPNRADMQTGITPVASLLKSTELPAEKADQTLSEIKNILQDFLHEIKKEAIPTGYEQCEPSKANHQETDTGSRNPPQPPFMTPFTNPCCYPVVTMCPMPCPMPVNPAYNLMPSQSFTCTNCANANKDTNSTHCCAKSAEATNPETQELIKEIYKFVAQNPSVKGKSDESNNCLSNNTTKTDNIILTSRSAGESFTNFQSDAKIVALSTRSTSKSCEALGSKVYADGYNLPVNGSYSDTVLEKLNFDAVTQSLSETAVNIPTEEIDKEKCNTFTKMLRSIGFLKKNKTDGVHRIRDNDAALTTPKKESPSPFRRDVLNYRVQSSHPTHIKSLYRRPTDFRSRTFEHSMTTREYQPESYEYHARPYTPYEYQTRPPPHEYPPRMYEYQPHGYPPPLHEYQPDPYEYQTRSDYRRDDVSFKLDANRKQRHPPVSVPISTYESSFSHMQPTVCLKEIEVKSTGTQSERKVSIFRKFKAKMQQPPPALLTQQSKAQFAQPSASQAPEDNRNRIPTTKTKKEPKPLFDWKLFQEKALRGMGEPDMAYINKKEMVSGDIKIRDLIVQKLFNKTSPFSPKHKMLRKMLAKNKTNLPTTHFKSRLFS